MHYFTKDRLAEVRYKYDTISERKTTKISAHTTLPLDWSVCHVGMWYWLGKSSDMSWMAESIPSRPQSSQRMACLLRFWQTSWITNPCIMGWSPTHGPMEMGLGQVICLLSVLNWLGTLSGFKPHAWIHPFQASRLPVDVLFGCHYQLIYHGVKLHPWT